MTRRAGRTPPIGLDLGACTVHAAQVTGDGVVVAMASMRRATPGEPYTAEEFERLGGVLYRQGFSGSACLVAAPKSVLMRATLDLPPRDSGAPLLAIARAEIARQSRAEADSFEFAWWDAPQPPRHAAATRAISVGLAHETAGALIAAIEASGLRVEGLFSPSTAAAAAIPSPTDGRPGGVLDLGWTDATLIVVGASEIVFERPMPACGLSRAVTRAAQARGMTAASFCSTISREADHPWRAEVAERALPGLVAEVRSSIEYLRGCDGQPVPGRITLAGGGGSLPGVREAIAASAGLAAEVAGPTPALAGAVGLSTLRGRCAILEAA